MPGMRRSGLAAGKLPWLALGIVLSAGCAGSSTTVVRSSLGENFELRAGQSATIGTEGLEVGFDSVSADSRCGKGETCVWEGDAIVRVWLRRDGSKRESLELHTVSTEPGSASYDGYTLQLVSLGPLPVSGRTIAPSDYVATFKVTAGETGSKALSLRPGQRTF